MITYLITFADNDRQSFHTKIVKAENKFEAIKEIGINHSTKRTCYAIINIIELGSEDDE